MVQSEVYWNKLVDRTKINMDAQYKVKNRKRKMKVEETGRNHLSVSKGLNHMELSTPCSLISLVSDNFFLFISSHTLAM